MRRRSLPDDLKDAQLQIAELYSTSEGVAEFRKSFFNNKRATILRVLPNGTEVVKMRLDVAALGANSKVRLVFVAVVTTQRVLYIELYAKSDKDREDAARIKRVISSLELPQEAATDW